MAVKRDKERRQDLPSNVWLQARSGFDTYPSAYGNLAASKYCKDPNYAKKSKGGERKGK